MNLNPESILKAFQEVVNFRPLLDKLEARVVSYIFQKSIDKLLIITELLPGIDKKEKIGYTSFLFRMNTRTKIKPSGENMPEEVKLSLHIKKQVGFLLDVLEETSNELMIQGSNAYLEYVLCCENLTIFDDIRVQQESKNNSWLINYLKTNTELKTNNLIEMQQYLLKSTGPCMEQAFVNTYAEENLERIYNQIKEQIRVQRNFFRLNENELSLKQNTNKVESENEEESKIHNEIQNHLCLLTSELMNKFEFWTKSYNIEVEKLDINLLQLKSDRDKQNEDLEQMQEKVLENEEILNTLREKVEEYERETEEKILKSRAATRIQRWWKAHLTKQKMLKRIKKGATEKATMKKREGKKKS